MPPTARRLLLALREQSQGGLVFPGTDGLVARSVLRGVYLATIAQAGVSRTRFHDLRHTYASLLIAGSTRNTSQRMGHASAAFTLDTYGHLMDRLPVRPVEWID